MNTSLPTPQRGVMGLLAAGVPLSLLADLVSPPNSVEVLLIERGRGEARTYTPGT